MQDITQQADILALTQSYGIFGVVWYVIVAIALWRVFSKAGYPGILAIIPIVNVFILVKVAGYSAWMTLWYLVPIANIVFSIFVALRLGGRFGKGGAFSFFLLWLFSVIGYLILGFGGARYRRA
ncbi:DUF5684 domain-containing protein [Leucobacter allii]|uniref:DUF5684 domain-containing protein n=1 Tax=Leucobacter allii TaxID=2932247 RepID=A0ABY4FQZ3_9MICO|nr:DUF5684 domain-containing protein [Leucobacter allii]UOQ58701.1 DUF5684 domain-containing protein [Leucobacter allii]UOR03228.1 DUF5684 domain-containing protein [Leucobacter allii]